MPIRAFILLLITSLILSCHGPQPATEIVPSAIFADSMVLQRDQKLKIWGTASPNSKIDVRIDSSFASTVSDDSGRWIAILPPRHAGGPYTLTLYGKDSIVFKNVLIGDVWMIAGSNNMGYTTKASYQDNKTRAFINNNIRMLEIIPGTSLNPETILNVNAWKSFVKDSSMTFRDFESTLGHILYDSLTIPIGIIHCKWFQSRIESWIASDSLLGLKPFKRIVASLEKQRAAKGRIPESFIERKYQDALLLWQSYIDSIQHYEQEMDKLFIKSANINEWRKMKLPVFWEQAGLSDYDGLVWFIKDVQIPKHWQAKDVSLSLGTIDDIDVTYVNNQRIGSTKQYNQFREYIIPAAIVQPNLRIAIKVIDAGGGGGFFGMPSDMKIKCGSDSLTMSGFWSYKADFTYRNIPDRPNYCRPNFFPSAIYNAMVVPMSEYPIKGVVWYNGESNVKNPTHYGNLLRLLINNWRDLREQSDLPFVVIQLPMSNEKTWNIIREEQYNTVVSMKETEIISTIDMGNCENNYSIMRTEIAHRTAMAILKKTYKRQVSHSGPRYIEHRVFGKKVEIYFDSFNKQLICSDGNLSGFEIAGMDEQYYEALGTIHNNKVIIYSPFVENPVAIRYAWLNCSKANLLCSDSIPAFPFRAEPWLQRIYEKDNEMTMLEKIIK